MKMAARFRTARRFFFELASGRGERIFVVELALAEVVQDLHPFQRLDLAVQVSPANAGCMPNGRSR